MNVVDTFVDVMYDVHMETNTPQVQVGDVIEDSYGNPAVVQSVDADGRVRTIVQTVGSDRGRRTYAPSVIRLITDARADWARGRVTV